MPGTCRPCTHQTCEWGTWGTGRGGSTGLSPKTLSQSRARGAGPLWAGGFASLSLGFCVEPGKWPRGAGALCARAEGDVLASLGPAAPRFTAEETETRKGRDLPWVCIGRQQTPGSDVTAGWSGRQSWRSGGWPGVEGQGSLWEGPRCLSPHPTCAVALQIPCGGGGRAREPAPHLLPGTAAAGGGEPGRRAPGRVGGGRSWSPCCSTLGFPRSTT